MTAPRSPQEIVDMVRQSTCTFPPIYGKWPGHPPRCSPHVDALIKDVDDWLEKTFEPGKKLDAYKATNFGLCAAYVHPDAPLERARILAFFYAFLFTLDDNMDRPGMAFGDNQEPFDLYVADAKRWIKYALGLGTDAAERIPDYKVIRNFQPIGDALRGAWSVTQRERFLKYFTVYLDNCMAEHRARREQQRGLPTLEEYWRVRLESTAILVAAVIWQYDDNVDIPDEVWYDEDMQTVIRATNLETGGRNDGISLRKELEDDVWHNLVLVMLYNDATLTPQSAIDKLGCQLGQWLEEREAAAARLTERWRDVPAIQEQIEAYVDCHRRFSIMIRSWDFESARYGYVKEEVKPDGSFVVDFTQPGKA